VPRYDEVAAGDPLPDLTVYLHRSDLVRYAQASGDHNPIHLDDQAARRAGLGGVIAHGMLSMALAGRILTDWVGDPTRVVDYGVRFTHPLPVPPDDQAPGGIPLQVGATVAALLDPPYVRVDINARTGGVVVLGAARAVVRLD
jgi:hypothetical protein